MKTLITNGTIVTGHETLQGDLLVEDGVVSALGHGLSAKGAAAGAAVLDAGGKLVLPGGVDAHTHITLNLDAAKGTDTYYRGTIPAAVGGTTTIIDHLAFMPSGRALEDHIAAYRALAQGMSVVDYLFHGLAQGQESVASEGLATLPESGFSSVKAYMTYDNHVDGGVLLRLLRRTKELGLLLALHAEDDATISALRAQYRAEGKGDPVWHAASRPVRSEEEAVVRALRLAAEAGDAPLYIVHLSSAAGLAAIRKARAAGQKNVYAETCTQYLCLTDDLYRSPVQGLRAVMSPPLRKREDIDALWDGIRNGEVQVVATDHCPFTIQDKMAGLHDFTRCPGGSPGIEERFALLYSEGVAKGRISLERFVACVAANPAKLFGLYPRKGALLPGSDADIVILDPKAGQTLQTGSLHGPSDFSLYEGMRLTGRIDAVFLRGKMIAANGAFTGERGMGTPLRPDGACADRSADLPCQPSCQPS
ncbi:D-stereospecific phenylhydantoinase [uncultured delta proteobacterium]|uniref:D-stereospecific phenylhydantoinase n=1 Tax=uncultured delta proteobacterium TaxID=34034 RepID=A0A212JBM0_9DELT|nr:D-stereospecific phenylhydantoinase [uncultured delta proteobacterium]